MIQEEANRYPHDCERCVYLGHYEQYDLYYCEPGQGMTKRPTVIARYGKWGGDYVSGMVFAYYPKQNPELAEARKRAIAAGLYSGDQYKLMRGGGWQRVESGGDI